ncbi:MAG: MBL fold metallo-hydrolase [Candidatus Dormibacteria bacterium]
MPRRQDLIVPSRPVSPVAEGITCISLPVPFNSGPVNTYLLDGPPLTLVDTGPGGIPPALGILEDALAGLGRRVEDIEQLVLTHSHLDHFGLAKTIRRRSGCRVLCHPRDRETIEDFYGSIRRQARDLGEAQVSLGFPEASARLIGKHFEYILSTAEPCDVDLELNHGDTLVIGTDRWEVLHTPGHSGGLICLLCRERRLLLADDMVLRYITPNPTMYSFRAGALSSGLPEYVDSLQLVRPLEVDITLPGHGPEITALPERVDEILFHHEERKLEIRRCLRLEPLTAAQLVTKVFGNLSGTDTFLAVRECLGHVVLLMGEGLAQAEEGEDGAVRYSAAGPE